MGRLFAVAIAALCCALAMGQGVKYHVYDLQPVPDNAISFANALNASGTATGNAAGTAFLWNQGTGTRFFCPFSCTGGQTGLGINDSGTVCGYLVPIPNNSVHAPFVFIPGLGPKFIGLPPESNEFSGEAADVNNSGVVCGWGQKPNGPEEPWIWSLPDGFQMLGSLGGKGAIPGAINDEKWVVGLSVVPSNEFIWHAFLWTPQLGMTDLGVPLGYKYSAATGINNLGWIVGKCLTPLGDTSGFLWAKGNLEVVLPWIPGHFYVPLCVNNNGVIGGQTNHGAFLWTRESGIIDPNSELDNQAVTDGWWLGDVRSVNDSGWICGQGHRTISGNRPRAYVAVPDQ